MLVIYFKILILFVSPFIEDYNKSQIILESLGAREAKGLNNSQNLLKSPMSEGGVHLYLSFDNDYMIYKLLFYWN